MTLAVSTEPVYLQIVPKPLLCRALAAQVYGLRLVLNKAVRTQLRSRTGGRGRFVFRITPTNGIFW